MSKLHSSYVIRGMCSTTGNRGVYMCSTAGDRGYMLQNRGYICVVKYFYCWQLGGCCKIGGC